MKLENYHPFVLFAYFMTVIFTTMFVANPIIICLSYLGAVCFCFYLYDYKTMLNSLLSSTLLILLMTAINPLIVHRGVTELLFVNGKPITLEAILYGLFTTVMLVSVFYWFKAYNKLMTSDKFLFLFSRFTPKIAVMLSMSMTFIPTLKRDYNSIKESQQALGIYTGENLVDKLKSSFRITSILFSLAIENSIEKAESMQARGYNTKGRKSFSIYRFKVSDLLMLIANIVLITIVVTLLGLNFGRFNYYPIMTTPTLNFEEILLYVASLFMYFLGVILAIKESVLWKISQSKM